MIKILLRSLGLLLFVSMMGCPAKPQCLPIEVNCGKAPIIEMKSPETVLELAEAYNRVVDIAVEEARIIRCYENTLKKEGK